ncbi:unnamed protein product [Linum trigynum]|uniref:Uncharacterized protein n=1 Tax=Linum trigynum TaxID=586398 RepID=A0AAV2EDH4_9ROSI
MSVDRLFQDNDRIRGPPAHLLQIEGMTLQYDIKLTYYNIANPTSEYTIIKIGKDEEEQTTDDIPDLIEVNNI